MKHNWEAQVVIFSAEISLELFMSGVVHIKHATCGNWKSNLDLPVMCDSLEPDVNKTQRVEKCSEDERTEKASWMKVFKNKASRVGTEFAFSLLIKEFVVHHISQICLFLD